VNKFWNFSNGEDGGRVLRFDGVIAAESWWGDEITPEVFRGELFAGEGDITVWLNSPGGDCIAASQIYTMLMDYKGIVTVKIDGIAASAASVIAMAGTQVLMAPTALMMCHNPMTFAMGDSAEMQKAIDMLAAVKETIINAYAIKSGQGRTKLSNMMDAETWLPAQTAIELGFADGMLEDVKQTSRPVDERTSAVASNFMFSRQAVTNSLLDKMKIQHRKPANIAIMATQKPQGITAESLEKRLSLISHN